MLRRSAPLLVVLALAIAAAGCGGDDDDGTTTSPTQPRATEGPAAEEPAANDRAPQPDGGDGGDGAEPAPPALSAEERAAAHTLRAYIRALDARDGSAVCALLLPGAIDEVELPHERGGCAASLRASIGYRDPRGLPVWEGAEVIQVRSVELSDSTAKVIATTVTRFADREEPSIEDDVVYLERAGTSWLVAKASASLYRAVGIADVPPSVLAPP